MQAVTARSVYNETVAVPIILCAVTPRSIFLPDNKQVNGTFACRYDPNKVGNIVLSDDWSNQIGTIFIIMLSVTLGLFSCCFMYATRHVTPFSHCLQLFVRGHSVLQSHQGARQWLHYTVNYFPSSFYCY